MNGNLTGKLLLKWGEATPLTDSELVELINGLKFVRDFCSGCGLSPMTVYYSMNLESMESALEARRARTVSQPLVP